MATDQDTQKLPLSVVIPVRNEELHLPACLDRLQRVAEVVVVDSSSTDRTPQIAAEYGARYLNFNWDGHFPKKRNWVLMNENLRCDWVLFLDADELVDDAFLDAACHAIEGTDKVGFWLNYDNYFLGKLLRYGVPQRKLAFFRRGAGLYERIEEDSWSQLDMEIHEHPVLEGEIGEIDARIEHRDFRGISKFVQKHLDYAQWEAARYAKLRDDDAAWSRLQPRQRFKYSHLAKWWFASFYFLTTYVLKLGFLDGAAGYHYASYKASYFRTIRLLISEAVPDSDPSARSG